MAEAYLSAMAAVTPHKVFAWRGGDAYLGDDALASCQADPGATDWFDAQRHLAGIKHRYLNDAARYSVAAALECLRPDEWASTWQRTPPERRGVFLGTAVADYAVRQAVDHSVMSRGFGAINTVSAPNVSANIAAAHVAIACQARAFSTTLTSPFLSGLEGLYFAAQSLQLAHTDAVMAIAAEESLHTDDTATPVMPGAVVLHLQAAGPGVGTKKIAASCWGHLNKDAVVPSRATQRFLNDVARVLHESPSAPELALLSYHSPLSATNSARWLGWLNSADLVFDRQREAIFPTVGTVSPMLAAAHCLTSPRPVLLLAIHQRRYLAFLFTPTHR